MSSGRLGRLNDNLYISNLTLSFLKDSGWYEINMDFLEHNPWGYKKGCDFL